MSRRTEDWDGPGTAFVVNDAIAYLDSLTLFFWQAPGADLLGALRKASQRRLIVKAYQVPRNFAGRRRGGHSKRWHVTIHQPEPETLANLSTIHRRFVVHAVHVAIDFLCPDRARADLATAFLTRGVVQKWRRRHHVSHLEANTRYWNANRKARRNIALYGDRPSKAGFGACSHFEMRFTGAAACKRAGLGDLSSLVRGVNAMALLKHQARIAFIDKRGFDRALEKQARRNLRGTQRRQRRPALTVSDIKKHLQRRLPPFIEDEGQHLNTETITKARSQELWNRLPMLRSCLRPVAWTDFTPEPRWVWLRRSSDQNAGAGAGGGTYGTTGNLHRIAWKPLIRVTNKSTPTRKPDEPNANSRDGDATNPTWAKQRRQL